MILNRMLALILSFGALLSAGIANSPFDTPSAPWVGQGEAKVWKAAAPAWEASYAKKFPTCAKALEGVTDLLAMDLQGEVAIHDFDEAWTRTHNKTAHDDLWVLGQCA